VVYDQILALRGEDGISGLEFFGTAAALGMNDPKASGKTTSP
jgi:hypothetical protein